MSILIKTFLHYPLDFYGKRSKILGHGSFGVVYEYIRDDGQKYAIKFIDDDTTFYKEINGLSSLSHPNIVNYVDCGFDGASHYIVMELAIADLDKYMEKNKMSETDKKSIMYQLISALIYIFNRGVIHGDIKPQNILVYGCKPNDPPLVKLCDVGFYISNSCQINKTRHIYTLWYRPPELLLDDEYNFDSSADIWAMGVTLYEIIYEKPLFAGRGTLDQIIKILRTLGTPTSSPFTHMKYFSKNLPYFKSKGIIRLKQDFIFNNMIKMDPHLRNINFSTTYFDDVILPETCTSKWETKNYSKSERLELNILPHAWKIPHSYERIKYQQLIFSEIDDIVAFQVSRNFDHIYPYILSQGQVSHRDTLIFIISLAQLYYKVTDNYTSEIMIKLVSNLLNEQLTEDIKKNIDETIITVLKKLKYRIISTTLLDFLYCFYDESLIDKYLNILKVKIIYSASDDLDNDFKDAIKEFNNLEVDYFKMKYNIYIK